MPLELHVWGPAFGLPSIDAPCLAAIAYLSLAVPREEWILMPSCGFETNERRGLPILKDAEVVTGGYENIVAYLSSRYGAWDLDASYTGPMDQADISAFSAHLSSHAPSLLALSLYVSSHNYTSTTRPAYNSILPWPTQYMIPPSQRTVAKTLTAPLGLDALDLDTLDEDEAIRRKNASLIPQSLRSGLAKQTVTQAVKEQQSSARFKLDALVDACCDPLARRLGQKRYLLSNDDRPSSLDALVVGYLSLALVPDVPQKWLADGIRQRYPGLCSYVQRGIREAFEGQVGSEQISGSAAELDSHSASLGSGYHPALPWRAANAAQHDSSSLTSTTTLLPFLRQAIPSLLSPTCIVHAPLSSSSSSPDDNFISPTHSHASVQSKTSLLPVTTVVGTMTTLAVAIGTYMFYPTLMGLTSSDRQEDDEKGEMKSLGEMGEAGRLFEGLDFGDG